MAELLKFELIPESSLRAHTGSSEWMMCDCGHDCCTCDSECK